MKRRPPRPGIGRNKLAVKRRPPRLVIGRNKLAVKRRPPRPGIGRNKLAVLRRPSRPVERGKKIAIPRSISPMARKRQIVTVMVMTRRSSLRKTLGVTQFIVYQGLSHSSYRPKPGRSVSPRHQRGTTTMFSNLDGQTFFTITFPGFAIVLLPSGEGFGRKLRGNQHQTLTSEQLRHANSQVVVYTTCPFNQNLYPVRELSSTSSVMVLTTYNTDQVLFTRGT